LRYYTTTSSRWRAPTLPATEPRDAVPEPGPLAGADRRTDVSAVPVASIWPCLTTSPRSRSSTWWSTASSSAPVSLRTDTPAHVTFTVGEAGSCGDNLTRHLRRGRTQLRRLWHQPHPPPHTIGFQRARACGFQMQYGSIGWSVGATLKYSEAVEERPTIAGIGAGCFQVNERVATCMYISKRCSYVKISD
ncbi:hypothetical protein BHM03_00055172, partial [Ensete ventricosum]